MRIIFHIGTYKTGSSSFQNFIFKNKHILHKHSFLYPSAGMARDNKLGYRHTPIIYNFLQGKDDPCPAALLEELRGSDAEVAILSSEAWSNPQNLSHLIRLTARLQECGFQDLSAILVLRNLGAYQISHYREFTAHRKNRQSFPLYIRSRPNHFDYLLLINVFRSIFGSQLNVLSFERNTNIVQSISEAIGIGEFYERMEPTERSNVKSIGALEIEAIRCANFLDKPSNNGISILTELLAERPELKNEHWTEAFEGYVPKFPSVYKDNLLDVLNWNECEVEKLFQIETVEGRNVQDITAIIMEQLQIK